MAMLNYQRVNQLISFCWSFCGTCEATKKTLPFTTATHDISWHLPIPAPKRPQVTSSSVGALRVVPNRMTLCLGEPFTKDFIIGQGTWRPRLIPVRFFCKNHPGDIQKSMLNCTKYPVKYIVIPGGSSWKYHEMMRRLWNISIYWKNHNHREHRGPTTIFRHGHSWLRSISEKSGWKAHPLIQWSPSLTTSTLGA